eukprot:4380608-Prymnesium_polylepis.1
MSPETVELWLAAATPMATPRGWGAPISGGDAVATAGRTPGRSRQAATNVAEHAWRAAQWL